MARPKGFEPLTPRFVVRRFYRVRYQAVLQARGMSALGAMPTLRLGGRHDFTPSSSSPAVTLSARASFSTTVIVGLRVPRSTSLTYVR